MRFQTLGLKPSKVWVTIQSGESTDDIKSGSPVAWKNNDGYTVTNLKTATGPLAVSGLVGVNEGRLKAGKVGLAQVYGICTARVLAITKANSDSTIDTSSFAAGLVLAPNTANDAFSTVASVAASAFVPLGAVLVSTSYAGQTAASSGTTLSNLGSLSEWLTGGTGYVVSASVFLRLM